MVKKNEEKEDEINMEMVLMKWLSYIVALVCMATILFGIAYPNFSGRPLCMSEPNLLVVAAEAILILWAGLQITGDFIREAKREKEGDLNGLRRNLQMPEVRHDEV